ncbi:ABC transporter permease [Arcanobacterium pinnipediorum]|uniref:ABC transporter permease n=1 Tax=Arcanobacterium pinnipediorum TaxID=1503041 RepID=A0ABY5AFN0_9ACTO|nr:ABC transporter permease [Arcanobacterium pinnipediorum]USR78980.1 ABC transporter permease [Arcanobacterium pinnipediorum]
MQTNKTSSLSAGAWAKAIGHAIPRSGWLVGIIAIVLAFLIGALLIMVTGASVFDAYGAMFKGSIFNASALNRGFTYAIRPFMDSLFYATPLILAGLGLGFGFRAGLFNIGGAGQMIFGSLAAIWVSFSYDLPYGIHLLVALLAAALAGGLYAGIAGYLKAKTGANEVIVTIMLNSIAALLLSYLLSLDSWHSPGQNNPITPVAQDTAALPALLPPPFKIHLGFILALIAVFAFWWILERSTFGFEVRAVGANPHAGRTAGMSIAKVTTLTMVVSGVFLGLAGANEALGTMYQGQQGVTAGVAGTIGFDAITVALLGRNRPLGVFFSGLLFGAFKAGGYAMQAQGVPVDMVLILESVIVLFIAAPALIRWMFHLPKPDGKGLREYAASIGATKTDRTDSDSHSEEKTEVTAVDAQASTGKGESA